MNKYFIDGSLRIKKFLIKENDEETTYQYTPEWIAYQKSSRLKEKLSHSDLPSNVKNFSFDNLFELKGIKSKLTKYTNFFSEKYSSIHLYFWSKENGTQKTTTASILGKELLLKGYSVQFILMSDLTKKLTKQDFEENLEINKYLISDFLIIDDSFDAKKMTVYKSGYQIPFLDTFLRTRLEVKRKATCFTSNVGLNQIDTNIFGASLVKLVQRSIIDPFHFDTPFSKRNDFNPDNLWN